MAGLRILLGVGLIVMMPDAYAFLKHIYTKHPPKIGNFKYDEKAVTADNVKKCVMKSITHYHPDK
jgi:hypothetical protein